MADLLHDFETSQPEGNNFNSEDFEKVDPYPAEPEVPEQDEEVTTTAYTEPTYTGEEAEEDRYIGGGVSDAASSSDPLSFGDDLTPSASQTTPVPDSEPLISFGGSPAHQASAPPKEPTPPPHSFEFEADSSVNTVTEPKVLSEPAEVSQPPEVEPQSDNVIELEIECVGNWFKNVDPRVRDLIYWRDVKKTGVVFGSMMFVLLSLSFFTVLSVLAYLSLAVLTVTLSFRVYKNVLQAVQKTNDGHPFKQCLDADISLPEEKVEQAVQNVLKHVNCTISELRSLFLIEDLVDSIKLALVLWVLTYVGSWFSGMTLIIMVVVTIFTIPKVYETYKTQIDNYISMARSQLNKIMSQIQAKLPFLKKKTKTQ